MRTLAFRSSKSPNGNYILLLHTAEAPATAEWRDYVSAVQSLLPGASAHAPREFAKVCEDCAVSLSDATREIQELQKTFPKVLMLDRMLESAR